MVIVQCDKKRMKLESGKGGKSMKKILLTLSALFLGTVLFAAMAACSDNTTLTKFEVPAAGNGEVGTVYVIERVTAIDSRDNKIQADVEVKDSAGNTVTVTDYTFIPTTLDPYTIYYTVEYGRNKTETKTSTVNIFDLTDPTIETDLTKDIFAPQGGSIDLSEITVKDNSGEDIRPQITVSRDGVVLDNVGNTLDLSTQGIYTIEVTAQDSSGNSAEATYNVHAISKLDAEHGVPLSNEWYATEISDEYARTGDYSYKVDLFGPNVNWFSDKAVFGECTTLLDSQYKYLSFWIYFDVEGAGFNGTVLVKDNQYNSRFYDERGNEILPRWGEETDGLYEFSDGMWYRWVIDTTEVIAGADGVLPSDRASFQDLCEYSVNLGVWDIDIGNNALHAVPVYIDDVQCIADDALLEESLADNWGPSSKGKKYVTYHDGDVIANYEIPEDVVSTSTCKSAERSQEQIFSGDWSLKLTGYPTNTWVTGSKIFRATNANGATRAMMWMYVPYGESGEAAVRLRDGSDQGPSLTNQKAYKMNADGTLSLLVTQQGASSQDWYTTIPLNTWFCIEFDLPEYGISEVTVIVESFWVNGQQLTPEVLGEDLLSVYIDDVKFVRTREYPVIADFEQPSDAVLTDVGCARAEISSEQKHGGEYSLRMQAWGSNSWLDVSGLFSKDIDAQGATRMSFWIYVPCVKDGAAQSGAYSIEKPANAAFYRADGVTVAEKPVLNEWIRVECDVPTDLSTFQLTVSTIWVDGQAAAESSEPVVYIDDVAFVQQA